MSSSSGRWLSVPLRLREGERVVVEAEDRRILLLRVGGDVHAFDDACPHQGNPLEDGEILGDVLECAYHGWRFDLATGACLLGDEPARRYPAELHPGEVRIRLDLGPDSE